MGYRQEGLLYPHGPATPRHGHRPPGRALRALARRIVPGRPARRRRRPALTSLRSRLNDDGDYTALGDRRPLAGTHVVRLRLSGAGLRPGSGGYPFGLGPLVLTTETAADVPVMLVDPANASSLCGKRLDWVETVGS